MQTLYFVLHVFHNIWKCVSNVLKFNRLNLINNSHSQSLIEFHQSLIEDFFILHLFLTDHRPTATQKALFTIQKGNPVL